MGWWGEMMGGVMGGDDGWVVGGDDGWGGGGR